MGLIVEAKRDDTGELLGDDEVILTIGGNRQVERLRVGTSEVAIPIEVTIGSVGLCYVWNDASAGYVDIGYSTGDYTHRIYAGEVGMIPLGITTSALYLVASASVSVDLEITERFGVA